MAGWQTKALHGVKLWDHSGMPPAKNRMTVRLSTGGRLVIPKPIRDRHGWTPAVELSLEDREDHLVLRRHAAELPEVTLDDLLGCAGYRGLGNDES